MTIEQKILSCMQGRSIIPEEYAALMKELHGKIRDYGNLSTAFTTRMKEESPIQVGDKVQLWGGGLTIENMCLIGVFYVRQIAVLADGSFKYYFWNVKKDGTQGKTPCSFDYSEIEKLG